MLCEGEVCVGDELLSEISAEDLPKTKERDTNKNAIPRSNMINARNLFLFIGAALSEFIHSIIL